MKCPRCGAAVTTPPDEAGLIVCPGCGVRLKRTPAAARVAVAASVASVADSKEAATIKEADSLLARREPSESPAATLPPGTPLKKIPRPEELALNERLEAVLREVRALRQTQDEILALLKARPASEAPGDDFVDFGADPAALEPRKSSRATALRSRRRKTALLIDDDEATRKAAAEALERADVPVTLAGDGGAGIAAIAQERPDVIVLELGVSGAMPGKDVINMIKATMEWVDIPIVLYTRLPVANQKEARTLHGADELVPKSGPRAAEQLVAHVVALFRKG